MKALVPLDGSDLALSVVPTARGLLGSVPGVEIHLLTVLDPRDVQGQADRGASEHAAVPVGSHGPTVATPLPRVVESHGQAMERRRTEAHERLNSIAREHFPGTAATCRAAYSRHPAATIAEVAAEIGADVIVMATHGRSGVASLVAGSVTQEVIRASGRPVLVICPLARHA